MLLLAQIVGLIGVGMIVLAYGLISAGKVTGDNPRYHLLNGVGAVLVLYSLYWEWNTASFVIEIIWVGISGYGLLKWRRARRCASTVSRTK